MEQKRFENWIEVDCNDCQFYWDDYCDGAKINSKGSRTLCTTFKPSRRVDIPQKLERLKSTVDLLKTWCLILSVLYCVILGVLLLG